jgi:NAD(P)H-dependent FMN reductase
MQKKNILAIIGSASENSINKRIVEKISGLNVDQFNVTIYTGLKGLPQFDPQLSADDPPEKIIKIRDAISKADGIIICTPEYIFSIPSGLKNLIEWCVSTTIFTDKPVGLITASLSGQKGHEELLLIMKTVMSKFTDGTTLLIEGVKGKIKETGEITDAEVEADLMKFIQAYKDLIL